MREETGRRSRQTSQDWMVMSACCSLWGLPGRALTPTDGPSPRLAVSTYSLCGFQLPTRVLGSYPPAPMDGCWSHCCDPLWDVPIEWSSQGRSAVIPTHVAGPVSFCLRAHTPGRKLWAGRAPRRKTSGCSDVP